MYTSNIQNVTEDTQPDYHALCVVFVTAKKMIWKRSISMVGLGDLINILYVFIVFILSFKKYSMDSFVIFERDINK